MSEQIATDTPIQTEPLETLDTTPAVTLDARGNAVDISVRQGIAVWQAIGLLETALILLKKQYSAVDAVVTPQETEA